MQTAQMIKQTRSLLHTSHTCSWIQPEARLYNIHGIGSLNGGSSCHVRREPRARNWDRTCDICPMPSQQTLGAVAYQLWNLSFCLLITEVKQCWAWLILWRETVPSVVWVQMLTVKVGLIWLAILYWLLAELATGQCRLGVHWACRLNIAWTCGRCQAGSEIPVDLPLWPFVFSRMKHKTSGTHITYSGSELQSRTRHLFSVLCAHISCPMVDRRSLLNQILALGMNKERERAS